MKCDKNSVQMSKLIGVFLDYGSFSELFFDGSGKRKISSPAFPFKLFFQLIGPKHAIALLVAWTGVCVCVCVSLFGKCNFRDPNLVTFYLCIYLINVVSRTECNAVSASLLLNLMKNNFLIFF